MTLAERLREMPSLRKLPVGLPGFGGKPGSAPRAAARPVPGLARLKGLREAGSVRLLPVLVVAAGALLALKTLGLVTGGGYVLGGLAFAETAPVAAEHGETEAPVCADGTVPVGGALDAAGALVSGAGNCVPATDVLPSQIDATGRTVPIGGASGGATERALLESLADRRQELEAYAGELATREALIAAAEQRIEERFAAMSALEAQISALVAAREAAEAELVSGIVVMYEQMRPRDAAAIFNTLDMTVLVQVARAMAPRRMSPILAAMDPVRARELTVRLAAAPSEPEARFTPAQFDALPQIVGQ